MYDFNENYSLYALLEQLKGAAVAVADGVVAEYNAAASHLLPDLRAGERLVKPESGVIELCGVRFNAVAYSVGNCEIYNFAAPANLSVESALPMLENMSRAIMNNLSVIFAASELIAGAAERERLENIVRHSAMLRHEQYKLLDIAENLRELCALESGRDVLAFKLIDLDELCLKIVNTVSALLHEKGIELVYSAEGADFLVYADARRVERMILAVLANSAESCTRDGQISLSLKKIAGQYEMLVQDNGSGIPDRIYGDVFESFAQPADAAEDVRGAGLGLAVARSTALRHGGNLMLQSVEGEGTKVLMSIPANKSGREEFNSPGVEYAANPMRPILAAFARVLDYKHYAPPYL